MAHQSRVLRWFSRALASGRVGGSYLLYGPGGDEGDRVASALAAALVCPRRTPSDGACGECESCRAAAAGTHADIVWARPESAAGHLTIAQIRDLRLRLGLSSVQGSLKVAVVSQADRMTADAANALLKTLEEPPGRVATFLVAREALSLPETVRSRCLRFYLRPAPSSAAGAGGFPEAKSEEAALWIQQALEDSPTRLDKMAQHLERTRDWDEVDDSLAAMIWLWRNVSVWRWTSRSETMSRSSLEPSLAKAAARVSLTGAAQALEAMMEARRLLAVYTSRRLVLDWVWMSLRTAAGPRHGSVAP